MPVSVSGVGFAPDSRGNRSNVIRRGSAAATYQRNSVVSNKPLVVVSQIEPPAPVP